jgi:hypothetical protein
MQVEINLKQLRWIPKRGEHRISVNVAGVPNLREVWGIAEEMGYKPELVAFNYPNRIEIHLLLLQEQLEPGTVLRFDDPHNALIDRLLDIFDSDAIRHSYGGAMAAEED